MKRPLMSTPPLPGRIKEYLYLFFNSNAWMVQSTARHLEVKSVDLPIEVGGALAEACTYLLARHSQLLVLDDHPVGRERFFPGRAFPDPSCSLCQ